MWGQQTGNLSVTFPACLAKGFSFRPTHGMLSPPSCPRRAAPRGGGAGAGASAASSSRCWSLGCSCPPHPRPGLPAAEGRTPRGSFSVPFPSQSSVFPGTTAFPCSGTGGWRTRTPGAAQTFWVCLRSTASAVSKPAAISEPDPARQPSMPACSGEAIKGPSVSCEPLLASSDWCRRCGNPPRGKPQSAPAAAMGPEPLPRQPPSWRKDALIQY